MRQMGALFFSILLTAGAIDARAQAVPAAKFRQISITAGGTASIFQTDYAGLSNESYTEPAASSSSYPLFGAGAFVDVKFTRWAQLEAEGRWLRWNQFQNISQDNYLIGPRLPVYRFRKAAFYAKALGGFSKMNFNPYGGHGSFTDFAFGGGMDVKLTKRISWRAADFEYQYWPWWGDSSISPYGASMGISYRIF